MKLASTFLVLVLVGRVSGVEYHTVNFRVRAETPEVAKIVAEAAEEQRVALSKLWLGTLLPNWAEPCGIQVAIDMDRTEGFTDIVFGNGRVGAHRVELKGPLEQLLKGPLPHEMTHVLFAHYFGCQPPRWADEGAAILSEDIGQGSRQQRILRRILAEGKQFPLRQFLPMTQYPEDLRCLYAQGHSIAQFLVSTKSREVFLAFVRDGLQYGWDEASRIRYGFQNVEQMERAWRDWVETQSEKGN